jgi:hypothetical protein
MIEEPKTGWEVAKTEEIEGTYLVTVSMTSADPYQYTEALHEELHNELIPHTHRYSTSVDLLTFDHSPSTEDIEEAVIGLGFSMKLPEVDNGVIVMYGPSNLEINNDGEVVRKTSAIKTITSGEEDVLEYNAKLHHVKFLELLSMVPVSLEKTPTSMSLKGDWLHLYYVSKEGLPPLQFFSDKFYLYSVRIHKDTGEIRRKGYNKGMALSNTITDALEGFNEINNIAATGVYLDEPRVTIYYMKSSDKKEYVENVAVVDIPYYGTTWENGKVIRTREYTREMNDV